MQNQFFSDLLQTVVPKNRRHSASTYWKLKQRKQKNKSTDFIRRAASCCSLFVSYFNKYTVVLITLVGICYEIFTRIELPCLNYLRQLRHGFGLKRKLQGNLFLERTPWLYNLRGLQDLARVYGPRPAITNFNRRACFGMGQAFRLCSICFLLLGACRVHPFPASPLALGKNERAVLQAPCFQ